MFWNKKEKASQQLRINYEIAINKQFEKVKQTLQKVCPHKDTEIEERLQYYGACPVGRIHIRKCLICDHVEEVTYEKYLKEKKKKKVKEIKELNKQVQDLEKRGV
jgi:hypothetical protein